MEVRLGEVAKTNAASEDVRAFGLRMVTDHSKANRELEAEAQRLGIALPSEMSKDDAERVAKLEKLHGTAFDRSYMDAMVKDHEEDVKAFRAEAKDTDSPLQAFAEKTTPTLESHLEQARRVKAALGAEGIGSTARRDPRPGSTRP
jgi:putative membrane protein